MLSYENREEGMINKNTSNEEIYKKAIDFIISNIEIDGCLDEEKNRELRKTLENITKMEKEYIQSKNALNNVWNLLLKKARLYLRSQKIEESKIEKIIQESKEDILVYIKNTRGIKD